MLAAAEWTEDGTDRATAEDRVAASGEGGESRRGKEKGLMYKDKYKRTEK